MSTHDDVPDSVSGSTGLPESTAPESTAPDSAAPAEPAPQRARLRVSTVVWGLVVATIGILVLATASGVTFDLGLVMIGLIGFAGIALLIGSIASGIRNRHP